MDIEKIMEPFDLDTANKLLTEGYCVRHSMWLTGEYIYMEDGELYNQDHEEAHSLILEQEKERTFELFYEEDQCQNQ